LRIIKIDGGMDSPTNLHLDKDGAEAQTGAASHTSPAGTKSGDTLTWDQRVGRWGPLIIIMAGVFMTAIGWLKWANPRVDFGAQVYVPWQISEGKVLYQDINYIYGPLVTHTHAFLFDLFGPSIHLLIVFNLALLAVAAYCIYHIFKKWADPYTATFCGVSFLVVFSMAEYHSSGLFNFICAYNYDLTQGAVWSYVTLFLFHKYLEKPGTWLLSGLGALTGMVYLTKPEIFLALFTSLFVGLPLALYNNHRSLNKILKGLLIAGGSFCLVPGAFWVYFSFHYSILEAFKVLLIPWLPIGNTQVLALPFYQWVMGIDDLPVNIMKMLGLAVTMIGIFLLLFLIETQFYSQSKEKKWIYPLAGILVVGPVVFWLKDIRCWLELGRPLPLFVTCLLIYYALTLKKALNRGENLKPLIFPLTFSLFAFVALFKVFFNTNVFHYGYVLAFPAFALLVQFLIFDAHRLIKIKTGHSHFFRMSASALFVIYILFHGSISYSLFELKNYPIASGSDRILDYNPDYSNHADVINEAVDYINGTFPLEEEYPVLPSGALLNYLPRRANPYPFIFFTPTETLIFKESDYIRLLENNPPEHILIQQMDHWEFGSRYFGKDFAQNLYKWIMKHYHRERLFGKEPFTGALYGQDYGIIILKKNSHTGDVGDPPQ